MKKTVLGVTVAGLVLGAAVAAFASPRKGDIPQLDTDGVRFYGAKYEFNRPGINHGAFEWSGRLEDRDAADGHNVYVEVKIHGHEWVRYYGKQRSSVGLHKFNWDGAQRYTGKARLRVCRDRGSLRPDNCVPERKFSHDWDHG